ncbi:threonine--tRNA ligase [Patescibacteria group bacterium]
MKKDDKLDDIRHSLAHLLAMAVLEKHPETKLAIGPTIENGFYYDFELPEGVSISLDALPKLTKQIKKLAQSKIDFVREDVSEDEARKLFADQPYKLELIDEITKEGGKLSVYRSGDFVDLCEGPHVENTSEINTDAFMLTTVAGAYWRGDEKNTQLTRVYGVAFETKEELEKYQEMIEEAKKRDHRKIGKEMGLFTFSDLVGAGLPLFTPKGTLIRHLITNKIWDLQNKFGWERVVIPHITKKELYETSGHWDKFGDELFKVKGKGDAEFVMKPMNCPHHTQIFAAQQHSYKDLPLRFAENGVVYRDEQAGELLGLSRVRAITQDDGHAFCTPQQVEDEIKNIVSIIKSFYTDLGMYEEGKFWVSLSVSDPEHPEKYMIEEDGLFLEAEKILEKIAKDEKLPYEKVEGEAAFYGPKLDFQFKDALGREWQLGTVQLDFSMPKRFGLEYTDKDGEKKTPIMIHRAIAGSLERFMAVMIEHFAGAFPTWLSPVQVKVLPIADAHKEYAEEVTQALKDANIRVELDDSNEGLGKKIRNTKLEKVPYFLVIGDKEVEDKKIMVESRDNGQLGEKTVEEFVKDIIKEVK